MLRILLSILLTTSLFAKDIIAVLELEQKGLTKQEAEILTDRLITKLISIDKYQVVERTNMDKILKEQKFQNSGCTDSECAVEIGQLLNTDYIVIGSVSKFGSMYSIDSRLIDVAQGKGIISAEFSEIGEIEVLMSSGITSIARQLCGMEGVTEIVTGTDKQKQVPPRKQNILVSPKESVKDIDGNTYKTVQIGKQLWMAENLKVTHYNNGDNIPHVYDKSRWKKLKTGAYSMYDNKSSNAETYGNLYNFAVIDDDRGVCPDGFHIPSDGEFTTLITYLDNNAKPQSNPESYIAGGMLKDTGTIKGGDGLWSYSPKNGANNESGFTGLPAGIRSGKSGDFSSMGKYGYFWSSSEYRRLDYYIPIVSRGSTPKRNGLSIRCLGD